MCCISSWPQIAVFLLATELKNKILPNIYFRCPEPWVKLVKASDFKEGSQRMLHWSEFPNRIYRQRSVVKVPRWGDCTPQNSSFQEPSPVRTKHQEAWPSTPSEKRRWGLNRWRQTPYFNASRRPSTSQLLRAPTITLQPTELSNSAFVPHSLDFLENMLSPPKLS